MTEKKGRADYLDVISGLLIIHMIVGHTIQFSGLYGTGVFYDNISRVLFFFMPWFYFKAGLFISRKGDLRSWIEKDARRLLVPYVIFTIIGTILYVPFEFLETDREWWKILGSPVVSVLKVGSMGGNLALWFLLNLFIARLILRLIPERAHPVVLVLAVACGAVLDHYGIILPLTLSTAFPGVAFILLGHYSRPYIKGERLIKAKWGGQLLIILLFVMSIVYLHPGCNMRLNDARSNYFVWIACSWLGCLTSIILIRKMPTIKPLAYIGRCSMKYYVLHWLPLFFASHVVRYFHPELDPYVMTTTLLTFVFLTLALFTWRDRWIPAWWVGEK